MQGVRDGTRRVCKSHFWAFFVVNFTFGLFLAMHCVNADLSTMLYLYVPTSYIHLLKDKLCWIYLVLFITFLFLFLTCFGFIHTYIIFRVGSSPTTEESLTVAFQKTRYLSKNKKKTGMSWDKKRIFKSKEVMMGS